MSEARLIQIENILERAILVRLDKIKTAHVDFDVVGPNTLFTVEAAPGADLRIYLTNVVHESDTTNPTRAEFFSDTGGLTLELKTRVRNNETRAISFVTPYPWPVNTPLVVESAAQTNFHLFLSYYIDK